MPEWLTEAVIVQTIVTAGVVLGSVVPAVLVFRAKLAVIGTDAREARDQVKNSHDTNLREESDDRHKATMDTLREMGRDIRGLRDDHQATRKDIGLLHSEDRAGRRETQQLRQDFQQHVDDTAPMLPAIQQLYDRYINSRL